MAVARDKVPTVSRASKNSDKRALQASGYALAALA